MVFDALRKKRASQQQQQAAANAAMQQTSQASMKQAGDSDGSKHASRQHLSIDPHDQATIDIIRAKSHSQHPHSKDGDDIAMQGMGYGDDDQDEEEDEEDDDDDDLFKFMPPTSYPQPSSSTSASPAPQATLTSSTFTPGGLLPAHRVDDDSRHPLQTATTLSTMNTDDIQAIPYISNTIVRGTETPPSVPNTAGESSFDHHITSPQKGGKQRRPPPTAQELTEAQKLARQYQSSHTSVHSKKSDTSSDEGQHVIHAISDTSPHGSGALKRKQPYVYPGSPVYTTTPGGLDGSGRQDTPVIELAERQRQPSSMTVSYPPEYGLHPDDTYTNESAARSHAYSQHYVDVSGVRQQNSSYLPQSPQTVRHRMSKTYSEHDETKSSLYRSGSNWNVSQTPGSKQDFTGEYGFDTTGSAIDSKFGGIGIESRDGQLRYPTAGRYATEDGMDSTAVGSTPGIGSGKDFKQFELEDEEDSPYPEVRASVSNIDDPEMPILTFRAWFLGLFFCAFGGGLNIFAQIRLPAPLITPLTVQIISYPFGKLLAHTLPTATHKTPRFLTWVGVPSEWSFNPGPFNIKEHTIIVLMVNVAIAPTYAPGFTITLDKFYNIPKGIAFDWLCLIVCNCVGFCFAGMCRRHLVWPASLIWPQNLVTCTLFNTFHAEDDDGSDGSLTRFRFFSYVAIAAAVWYIFPGFLFTGLSAFSFLCWMAPKSKIVNQLFGVSTGLGMSGLTFDWSQITYIGSPLVVPWWAEVNIFVGFVLLYWIVVPILYYTNTWNFAFMPISTAGNFDRWGQFYNISRVLTPEITLDEAGYLGYSRLFMSTTYTVVYALSFTLSTAAVVHTILYNGKDIYLKIRNASTEMEDVHSKLMRNYPEVPDWWYWSIFVVCSGIGIATIEVYDTQLPVWMFLMAIVVAGLYVLPGGYIYAMTSQLIAINLIAETIPGYALPGKPVANILFKTISIQCLQAALCFIQDLKLGHYMKIPPRTTFMVQLIGTLVACASQLGVKRAIEVLVPDMCSPVQSAGLRCALSAVMFEASIIWGIIGPERFFGPSSPYHSLLYFTIVGALLPIPFWLLQKRYPRSWIKYINIPVLINGATYIPPATGINYSSWFIVGFVFQFLLRRFRFRWWSKFCFVTAAGLEGGTILSAIILFFALQLPMGGRLKPAWWGNEVYKNTGDWQGVTHMTPPEEGFGPSTWS